MWLGLERKGCRTDRPVGIGLRCFPDSRVEIVSDLWVQPCFSPLTLFCRYRPGSTILHTVGDKGSAIPWPSVYRFDIMCFIEDEHHFDLADN